MNQFTGGKLTQRVTADKSNSAKQILSLLLYCRCIHLLLLTFTYSFCRGASEFTSHFNSEAPELYCHVTDSAPCWLFRLVCVCVCQLLSWDRSWCRNVSVILSILASAWFTLSTASLLSTRKWQMQESSLFLCNAFHTTFSLLRALLLFNFIYTAFNGVISDVFNNNNIAVAMKL